METMQVTEQTTEQKYQIKAQRLQNIVNLVLEIDSEQLNIHLFWELERDMRDASTYKDFPELEPETLRNYAKDLDFLLSSIDWEPIAEPIEKGCKMFAKEAIWLAEEIAQEKENK
jgi:hypothetical protein